MDRRLFKILVLTFVTAMLVSSLSAQHINNVDRDRAQSMLATVAADVRKYYYDPKLHGVDWDAKVAEERENISKAVTYQEAVLDIAALLETLNDSHTNFDPPSDPVPQEYGWRYQMIGERCFVTHVQPKSDAESKGVKAGDEVLTLSGFTPTREALDKIQYVVDRLVPMSMLEADLRPLSGKIHHVVVKAKQRKHGSLAMDADLTGRDEWRERLEAEDERRLYRPQFKELSDDILVIRLPIFYVTEIVLDEILGKARKHQTVIFDLRGNPGGAESNLSELLSGVFEKDVPVFLRVKRDEKKSVSVKASHKPFTGKVIVLVDSQSASASELFARVIQIEKRGIVVGDRSSGSVMEARFYQHENGTLTTFRYGAEISEADLIMTDGKSLEHLGVTPDEVVLPTPADLAANRDPAMVRAAGIAGITLNPEQAGALFPFEWPKK